MAFGSRPMRPKLGQPRIVAQMSGRVSSRSPKYGAETHIPPNVRDRHLRARYGTRCRLPDLPGTQLFKKLCESDDLCGSVLGLRL